MDHKWKPKRLALSSVKELAALQMREGALRTSDVRGLARAMDEGREVPPIMVARIGRALCVVDGFHRLAAARSLGWESIDALVAPLDLKAARAFARGVNHGHGKRLTPRDKRKAFASYIADGAHLDVRGNLKSGRVIASEESGGYSHTRVYALLREHGIEPNYALEEAEGSKWARGGWGYPEDADDGDDDDFDDGAEGAIDAEGAAEALGHIEAIGPLYFALSDGRRRATLGAVRELLARLEANEAPAVPVEPVLDI